MVSSKVPWVFLANIDADEFVLKMTKLGLPLETSLVGSFESSGRGSRRDIELGMHKDGEYTTKFKNKVDIVGLYCLKSGDCKTVIKPEGKGESTFVLKKGQAVIFDNNICKHARTGLVKDRILLRIWIQRTC